MRTLKTICSERNTIEFCKKFLTNSNLSCQSDSKKNGTQGMVNSLQKIDLQAVDWTNIGHLLIHLSDIGKR